MSGKSSLFNRLVERDRAIVTATPGTTRDLVSETVAIGGIPVKLVDTAGIRHALDEAESIGIRKSMEALADADLVLVVLDASHRSLRKTRSCSRRYRAAMPFVGESLVEDGKDSVAEPGAAGHSGFPGEVRTSALTGDGIEKLKAEILRQVGGDVGGQREIGFLTNVRHQGLVRDSLSALGRGRGGGCQQDSSRDDPDGSLQLRCDRLMRSPARRRTTTSSISSSVPSASGSNVLSESFGKANLRR